MDPVKPVADVAALVLRLRAAGCVFAEDEAALIVEAASTSGQVEAQVEALAARRIAGEPLEQVLGWAEFCGLRIVVEPGVFVPRRRTGFLVAQAVARAAARPVVLDLCCGSGAVGAAVAHAVTPAELVAVDLDPVEVRCARRNLAPFGGIVHQGDLFDALPDTLRGRVDVLTANVPYVPSDAIALMPPEARDHEPRMALDGGPDGLDLVRRVAAEAPAWLAPGGHLFVETGERQAPTAAEVFTAAGLAATVRSDEELGATVVIGTAVSGPARRPS